MEPSHSSSTLHTARPRAARPRWSQFLGGGNAGLLIAYLGMVVVFALISPFFLTVPNIVNVAQTLAIIGVVAAGETLVIVHGGFDLSVGATAALSGVIIGILFTNHILPVWPATLLGLSAGALVGLANGLIITRLRINAIITTLGTLSIVRGMAFVLSGGQTNQLNVESFKFVGRGEIGSVPVPLIIMVVVYAIVFILMRHSAFGREVYAVGGNPDAARLAGIDVNRVRVRVYLLCGLLSALGGVILAAQLAASFPKAAAGLELTVIAAVILGGSSLSGGKGTIVGTLLGVFILRTLDNGLVIANVSSYYQEVARGLVLLVAVGFDQIRARRVQLQRR
jgi:ribose transport system permease protein